MVGGDPVPLGPSTPRDVAQRSGDVALVAIASGAGERAGEDHRATAVACLGCGASPRSHPPADDDRLQLGAAMRAAVAPAAQEPRRISLPVGVPPYWKSLPLAQLAARSGRLRRSLPRLRGGGHRS